MLKQKFEQLFTINRLLEQKINYTNRAYAKIIFRFSHNLIIDHGLNGLNDSHQKNCHLKNVLIVRKSLFIYTYLIFKLLYKITV